MVRKVQVERHCLYINLTAVAQKALHLTAIRGMGEKFTANPVTGTGSLTLPIPIRR
jgi:hypothetical protein